MPPRSGVVASRAEAWIETPVTPPVRAISVVATPAEAGNITISHLRTPHTRNTRGSRRRRGKGGGGGGGGGGAISVVASRAEAWIETILQRQRRPKSSPSPPVRRRGLKLSVAGMRTAKVRSPPVRRRGLKLQTGAKHGENFLSPPVRRRGLKHESNPPLADVPSSPPVRRRGLKPEFGHKPSMKKIVASRAEAWIETGLGQPCRKRYLVASRAEAWIETGQRPGA